MQLPNTEEINLMGNEKDWVAAKYQSKKKDRREGRFKQQGWSNISDSGALWISDALIRIVQLKGYIHIQIETKKSEQFWSLASQVGNIQPM